MHTALACMHFLLFLHPMLKIFPALLLTLFSFKAFSQDLPKRSDYSFVETNIFQQVRAAWFFGLTPSFKVWDPESDFETRSTSMVISLAGGGYEPRVNLYDIKDQASISLSIPFDFSLGLAVSTPNDAVNTGFFAVSTGAFLDFNLGNHATYNNISKRGYSVGVGYRVHKAPLLGISDTNDKFSRLSVGPAVRFQYKRDFSNANNKVTYIEAGIPESFVYGGEKHIANTYILFGLGRLLNY